MNYGYIRVSTDKQTVENQRYEISEFALRNNLKIDYWIEETISGTLEPSRRQLGTLLEKIQKENKGRKTLAYFKNNQHSLFFSCFVFSRFNLFYDVTGSAIQNIRNSGYI